MDRSGFLRLFCLLDGDENRNYLRAYTLYIACTSNDNTVHLLLTPRLRLRSPTITILSYAARILQLASNDTLSSLSCSSRALVLPQPILPFFRVLASVLAPDNSSSRPLGQRSSFPAYQFLTTDWFSRKYSSLMNTVSFHSFLNRMSVFCIQVQVFVSRTSVSNFLFSSDEPRCFFFYPSFPSRNYSSKFAYVYKRCSLKPRMNLAKVIRGRESKFEFEAFVRSIIVHLGFFNLVDDFLSKGDDVSRNDIEKG